MERTQSRTNGHVVVHRSTGKNRVKWFTDNQAVAKIITSGSMKEELQKIVVDIFSFCVTKKHLPWGGVDSKNREWKGRLYQ